MLGRCRVEVVEVVAARLDSPMEPRLRLNNRAHLRIGSASVFEIGYIVASGTRTAMDSFEILTATAEA